MLILESLSFFKVLPLRLLRRGRLHGHSKHIQQDVVRPADRASHRGDTRHQHDAHIHRAARVRRCSVWDECFHGQWGICHAPL